MSASKYTTKGIFKETVTIIHWAYIDALNKFNEQGKQLVEVTFLIQCIICRRDEKIQK